MRTLAAIFVDYENILYHLKEEYGDPPQVADIIVELLRNLRSYMLESNQFNVIIFKAYADFERVPAALGSLYLMGVDTYNVLGTDHKNAADMRLCIDLMETLYTRTDIEHFVLVAGDRDYIPVVQHLRRQAKQVTAVAFRKTISGDLLQILGKENLLDADQFVKGVIRAELIMHQKKVVEGMGLTVKGYVELPAEKKKKSIESTATTASIPTLRNAGKKTSPEIVLENIFEKSNSLNSTNALDCLEQLLRFAAQKNVNEVWLSPFLRFLTDEMPLLADYERKELINTLRINGAIRIEKRTGDVYDFSVIFINYDHPDVKRLMP